MMLRLTLFILSLTSVLFSSFANGNFCSHRFHQNQQTATPNAISDNRWNSFDLSHINLELDLSDFQSQTLYGKASIDGEIISFGEQEIQFDLQELSVDSVFVGGTLAQFSHNDTVLTIQFLSALNQGDLFEIDIFYHGNPAQDPQWGGFYWNNNYAYNLGVAFQSNPHNFGRVWHPCFDNFTEKTTYAFHVTTRDDHMAVCGGLAQGNTNNGDGTITWHWQLDQPIPSYLASIAVADYSLIEYEHQGIESLIPVVLAAREGDTASMSASFVNLGGAIDAFEAAYGEHRFDRIGFNIVPFNGGAMEHATNISYPQFGIAGGGLTYESLMAHELAHHWWGDHSTCTQAEDMWLNEGWASYSEYLFFEHVYGRERYIDEVNALHHQVLQFAHVEDDGYRAVSGVPHEYTYGTHVYSKGADMIHTLRTFMGDQEFFRCITAFHDTINFGNVSTSGFEQFLSDCSDRNLEPFFLAWIERKGFTQFSIDEMSQEDLGGTVRVALSVRQKLNNAPDFFNDVPIDFTFYGNDGLEETQTVRLSGECNIIEFEIPFMAEMVVIDKFHRLSDAMTSDELVLNSLGSTTLNDAKMTIELVQQADSGDILFRAEHHWVAPDAMQNAPSGLHLSDYRYWRIDGLWSGGTEFNAIFPFNGSNSATAGHLDNALITNSEDSLVLLYRPDPLSNWQIFDDFSINVQGSPNNRVGWINANGIEKGEYCLAIYDHSRAANPNPAVPCRITYIEEPSEELVTIFPNPASDYVSVRIGQLIGSNSKTERINRLQISDLSGKLVSSFLIALGEREVNIDTSSMQKGVYLVKLYSGSTVIGSTKLILQ